MAFKPGETCADGALDWGVQAPDTVGECSSTSADFGSESCVPLLRRLTNSLIA